MRTSGRDTRRRCVVAIDPRAHAHDTQTRPTVGACARTCARLNPQSTPITLTPTTQVLRRRTMDVTLSPSAKRDHSRKLGRRMSDGGSTHQVTVTRSGFLELWMLRNGLVVRARGRRAGRLEAGTRSRALATSLGGALRAPHASDQRCACAIHVRKPSYVYFPRPPASSPRAHPTERGDTRGRRRGV